MKASRAISDTFISTEIKNVRKVPFNYIAFTKSYIKSDMHATRLLGKPLDKFKLI